MDVKCEHGFPHRELCSAREMDENQGEGHSGSPGDLT